MAASANTTNQTNLLKIMWGKELQVPFLKRSKFANRMKKSTDFGGRSREVVIKVAPTGGGSAGFAAALASQSASVPVTFTVTRRTEYQVFTVQGQAIAASKGDAQAYIKILKSESDSARYMFFRELAKKAKGKGGGSLGQIDSTTTMSSTTLILSNPTDHVNFESGMQLEFSADDGTQTSPAGLRGSPTYLTVSAVNRNLTNPTLTMSAALDTVSGLVVTDDIFRRGDYGNAMTGIDGWAPSTAPSASESFFGVDRTDYDVQRVAGLIYSTGTGGLMSDILTDACARADECGISIDTIWMHTRRIATLQKEVGTQRIRDNVGDGGIGYKSFSFDLPVGNGTVDIMGEKDINYAYAWGLDMSEVYLRTAGEAPSLLNHSGVGPLLPAHDDDAVQGRLGCYGNYFHENPGNSLVIQW